MKADIRYTVENGMILIDAENLQKLRRLLRSHP